MYNHECHAKHDNNYNYCAVVRFNSLTYFVRYPVAGLIQWFWNKRSGLGSSKAMLMLLSGWVTINLLNSLNLCEDLTIHSRTVTVNMNNNKQLLLYMFIWFYTYTIIVMIPMFLLSIIRILFMKLIIALQKSQNFNIILLLFNSVIF